MIILSDIEHVLHVNCYLYHRNSATVTWSLSLDVNSEFNNITQLMMNIFMNLY